MHAPVHISLQVIDDLMRYFWLAVTIYREPIRVEFRSRRKIFCQMRFNVFLSSG